MKDIEIRLAKENELEEVVDILKEAKRIFKDMDIPQWQTSDYPAYEDIEIDYKNDALYIIEKDNTIIGTASILIRFDAHKYDEYDTIFEGEWLNDNPYVVVHRSAIRNIERGKGYMSKFFDKAKEVAINNGIKDIRVDTHEKNKPMLKAINKYGFVYCGKIIVLDKTERLAYQLKLD